MRKATLAAFAALTLAACNATTGGGSEPTTSTPVAAPAVSAFPSAEEIAAGRVINNITADTSIGAYGRPSRVARNRECGFVRDGVSTSPLAVSSPRGPVSIGFDLGGCERTHSDRGVPYTKMTKVVVLASGAFLEGPTHACWLPNQGTPACRDK